MIAVVLSLDDAEAVGESDSLVTEGDPISVVMLVLSMIKSFSVVASGVISSEVVSMSDVTAVDL